MLASPPDWLRVTIAVQSLACARVLMLIFANFMGIATIFVKLAG